jgi:hypothetical protein
MTNYSWRYFIEKRQHKALLQIKIAFLLTCVMLVLTLIARVY